MQAQRAASATTGSASPQSRAAAGARVGSPLLPIAISTLRTNRFRPMRLTGDPTKRARKAGVVQRREFRQRRRRQVRPRPQLRFPAGLGEAVPGADRQAVVAAVDAVADCGAQVVRDRTAVLDREVGDAAGSIQPVGRGEGVGGADAQAARAAFRSGLRAGGSGGSSSVV